ncbi:hypothetical protein ACI65C_004643 [Semiaphis heraclei]
MAHRQHFSKSTKRRRFTEEVDVVDLFREHSVERLNQIPEVIPVASTSSHINNITDENEYTAQSSILKPSSCSDTDDIYDTNKSDVYELLDSSSDSDIDGPTEELLGNMNSSGFNLCNNNDAESILKVIAQWAVSYNITNVALSALLKSLKSHKCFNKFPIDARTVLKTNLNNHSMHIKSVTPGMYYHFVVCAKKLYFKFIVIDFAKFKLKISYDFSNNKQCKLADSENEDKNQSQFTNEGKSSTSEKKNGWSPSPQKLRLIKSQPITTVASSFKSLTKSTSQEIFKGSSNKRIKYNQDENEQGSELKSKNIGIRNPVSRKKLFDNKSNDEHVMLNDVVYSPEYQNINYEDDSNEQVVEDIRPRNINNSKRQSTQYNVSIVNDDLDKQLFSKPTGYNDSIKKQIKFKSTPLNEIEDIIKYILAQSPFSLKRQLQKTTVPNSIKKN